MKQTYMLYILLVLNLFMFASTFTYQSDIGKDYYNMLEKKQRATHKKDRSRLRACIL